MRKRTDRDEVVKMYCIDRLSTVQIAEKLNSTVGAIGSVLKHRGVKLRSPKEGWALRYPNGRMGSLAANWRGGVRKAGAYRYVYAPDHPHATHEGYVMEHRVVMEKHLGRFLRKDEFVHHKDGDKSNNALSNLELMKSRREHSRKHFDAVKEVARLKSILDKARIEY